MVTELLIWQQQGYLSKQIWQDNLFSPTLLPQHSSTSNETEQETHVSPTEPTISDQERVAFENEQLDPAVWVPKLCKHFNIDNLNLLKEVKWEQVAKFLDGINNTTIHGALKSLLRELKCLCIPSFELKNLTDLPDGMEKKMKYLTLNRDDGGSACNELVDQLVCTIRKWHQSSSYEFLTCLATLSLFDFSLEEFSFNHGLQEEDIKILSTTLRRNFDDLKSLKTIQDKQAFVLNIALNNPQDKGKSVHYILGRLPNKISKKFTGCTGQNFDLIKLYKAVKEIITRKDGKMLKEKAKSLSMSFNLIFSRKLSSSQIKEENVEVKEAVQSLLEDLGLTEYYPQKLGYGDVIKLTEDALKDVNEKPSTLTELPWYFMRRLIGLNSTIRERGSVVGQKKGKKRKRNKTKAKVEKKRRLSEVEDDEITFSWDDDSTDEEVEDKKARTQHSPEKKITGNVTNSVHPLDLIYIIFLCADDFLRQELADKMSKCQYAVPFILPSPAENGDQSQNTVLHWGLQAISRTYSEEKGPVVTKNLVNISCPLVSFLSLNTNTTWTSRLINKMLSPQQDTFWHEGLEGGKCPQKVSQGLVEVSWYLPAGQGNDEFKTPVTFANLRGDAHMHPIVTENLTKSSTTTCIFTDRITKEVVTFLETYFGRKYLKKIVLVVLFNPAEEKLHSKNCEKLKMKLKLKDFQVINCPLEDSSFHMTYNSLKTSLQTAIEETTSLSKFIAEVKSNGCMKVDDKACSEGYMAAQGILSDIEAINSDDVKSKILPCQSDIATREKIGQHEKEICRQKNIAESDLITQYVSREEEEKWQLQWKQLQYPISDIFTHFLMYITNLNPINKKYFLQSLKQGLNERSVELLQPLYEEYQMCRLDEQSEKTDRKLKKLNEQLMYSSLGLEHFFREVAVMYENMAALSEKLSPKENQLEEVLDTFSKTMADILREGEAIEILDGDVVHCPVVWLKAVLNQIENSRKVFKVSALGAQSSGKSTLLNTVFGLNFPVSSGRCTRGAYMQLVKMDEKLSRRLHCDYLMVIDSEGLMSRVSKNDDYDNELATFVIGLSDLTLVVIKGEGNEMQDILPIAIHVFLRMNVLGELQACHFVHQNMGAVDVKKTMPIEIDTFVQLLDEKTRAAAQEAKKKKYQRFADVLDYDKNKDNPYVCGLWDGTPPMGKTALEYSKTMQCLKGNILERLEMIVKKKNCSTIQDFSKWLEDIWEAIKYENFVFSFRNVLAVEAYKRLSGILNDKEWDIKKTMRENMDKMKIEIKDKLMTETDNNRVLTVIDDMIGKVFQNVRHRIDKLSICIGHYFDCTGCQREDCKKEVRNRQFLRDYKGEFERDIWRFMKALEEEISQSANSLAVEMSLQQDNAKMDDILKKEVYKLISKVKYKSLSQHDKENIFDALWERETEEILRQIPQKKKPELFIKKTVEKAIRDSLGSEDFRYIKKKADKFMKFDNESFTIKKEHANGDTNPAPHELRNLRIASELVVKTTASHYSKLKKGRDFEPKHAETLFKDIQSLIDQMKDKVIETNMDYNVDLMLYVEELAVRNFSWNQRKYEEISSPEGLLEKKRNAYHDVFLTATGQGNLAEGFGNIISKLIEENLEDRVTCTELLQILRNDSRGIFRNAEALKSFSIAYSFETNEMYSLQIISIEKYKDMVMQTIHEKSISCLEKKNLLKEHTTLILIRIIAEMKLAVDKTVQSNCGSENFIQTLFLNMNGLKKPHNDIEAYKMVVVDDKVKFASSLINQLGTIQNQLEQSIESWDIATIIERKGLTEFIFKEIIGCPFCDLKSNHLDYTFDFLRDIVAEDVRYGVRLKLLEDSYEELVAHSCHRNVDSAMIQAEILKRDYRRLSNDVFIGWGRGLEFEEQIENEELKIQQMTLNLLQSHSSGRLSK